MTLPLIVLGVTGSIGSQTLEVADHLGIPVAGLACRMPGPAIETLARRFPDSRVVVTGGTAEDRGGLQRMLGGRVSFGAEAIDELAATPGTICVNGVVGAAGLRPTLRALDAGNRVALANKESLVAGGPLVAEAADRGGGEIIPVDSEHSALFQLLEGRSADDVASLILTASGGPFRGRSAASLQAVTPAEALRHPTWDMGGRISVDSATLVNKGLEVLEAHVLFGVGFDRIEVVVHPQSLVHSLIRLVDGALLAHVGATDMRIAIQYSLTHPERAPSPDTSFDLVGRELTFEEPDHAAFPALGLAYRAGRAGGAMPAVFNAADEVAVAAFLEDRLAFPSIASVIEATMDSVGAGQVTSVQEVLAIDEEARRRAEEAVSAIGGGRAPAAVPEAGVDKTGR